MATETTFVMNDDLDPRISSGVETVTFFDPSTGQKREIELGEANRRHLANHLVKLARYIEASRVVEAAPTTKPAKAAATGEQTKIRNWAKANGYAVGDRGRIKAEIVDAYWAHQDAKLNTEQRSNETDLEAVKVEERTPDGYLDPTAEAIDKEFQAEADKALEGSQEAAKGTDEAWQGDGPTDADILALMAEVDSETDGNFDLEDLAAKLDNQDETN